MPRKSIIAANQPLDGGLPEPEAANLSPPDLEAAEFADIAPENQASSQTGAEDCECQENIAGLQAEFTEKPPGSQTG
jgi:hypothetical protein